MNFDLNIDTILEHWEPSYAVREIISNALDEQSLTGTREIDIIKKNNNWYIRDYGRGLHYKHFVQNEDDEKIKSTKVIGKFGFGLKDALGCFNRNKISVEIRSRHGKYTVAKIKKEGFDCETLHIKIEKNDDMEGTEFIFSNIPDDEIQKAMDNFMKYRKFKVIESTKYGDIIETPGLIFLNGILIKEEHNFLFSYNVTSITPAMRKRLNRERTNVGREVYGNRVKQILLLSKKVDDQLIDSYMNKSHDETTWKEIELKCIRKMNTGDYIFISTADMLHNKSIVDKYTRQGKKVVIIDNKMKKALEKTLDDNNEKIMTITEMRNKVKNNYMFSFIERNKLQPFEIQTLNKADNILTKMKMLINYRISDTLEKDGSTVIGLYSPVHGIIIRRDQLKKLNDFLGVYLHEYTHFKTNTSDITLEFECALTQMLGNVARHVEYI
jgi:hypothetical protein